MLRVRSSVARLITAWRSLKKLHSCTLRASRSPQGSVIRGAPRVGFSIICVFAVAVTVVAVAIIGLRVDAARAESQNSSLNELRALRKDVEALRVQVAEIRADTKYLTKLFTQGKRLEGPTSVITFQPSKLSLENPYLGDEQAPLVVMEFYDYECEYCAQYHKSVFPRLKKEYIDTGKVRFIFRDLILGPTPGSAPAASFAACAGQQGEFLQAHDLLFSHREEVRSGKFGELSNLLPNIDLAALNTCLNSPRYRVPFGKEGPEPSAEARDDMQEAEALQLTGTPAFVLFKGDQKGPELKGVLIRGSQSYELFKDTLDRMLQEREAPHE